MDLPLEPIGVPPSDESRPTLFECDDIEPMLGAHLDRELTRAEEVRVDEHLDACPRCRARREHLEELSGVLKGWEASAITPVPPDLRLKNAVLARVADTSHLRRIDDRVLRLTNWAVAACVVLGLGLGIILGSSWVTPTNADTGAGVGAVAFELHEDSLPDVGLGERTAFDLDDLSAKSSLDDLGVYEAKEPLPERKPMSAIDDSRIRWLIAQTQLFERRREVRRATGEDVAVIQGPDGSIRYVPAGLRSSPAMRSILEALGGAGSTTIAAKDPEVDRTTPLSVTGEQTGMTVAQLLSPLGGLLKGELTDRNTPPAVFVWPADGGQPQFRRLRPIEARGIRRSNAARRPALTSTDGVESRYDRTQVVDPLAAQDAGKLTLEDSPVDSYDVVVRVNGTDGPIYIPAGQVLSDGLTDRVTTKALWIPKPRDGELRFTLECMPIRRGPDRTAKPQTANPRITRWIVGPSLRALIARGTTTSELLAAAERQFDASGMRRERHDQFSLLDLLRDPRSGALNANVEWDKGLRSDELAGFLFTNGRDEVLGVEVVRFTGKAASKLLARLWVSYQFEAALRRGVDKRGTVSREGRRLRDELRALQRSTDVFFGKTDEQLLRVSSSDIARSRLTFQAAELGRQTKSGKPEFVPLHVSGMPRLETR